MNLLTMILGLAVGLAATILVGVTMAATKLISLGRDALTIKKAPRKTSTTSRGVSSTGASVGQMPERKRDAEIRPAA